MKPPTNLELRRALDDFADGPLKALAYKLASAFDDEQFERSTETAVSMLKQLQNEQRGPALFAALAVAQCICEAWRETPVEADMPRHVM